MGRASYPALVINTPRRALLVPLVLVLVPLSLFQTIWRLSTGSETSQVINGILVLAPAGWPEVAVTALLWTWALAAGVFVLGRGAPRPLRRALPVLPTAFGALFVAGAVVVAGIPLLGLALPAEPALIGVVAVGLAVSVAPILVRLALVVPVAVFDGIRGMTAYRRASALVRGRVWRIGFLLLLGLAAPAQLAGWALAWIERAAEGYLVGLALWLIKDVVLAALVALQASTLVAAYRKLPAGQLLCSANQEARQTSRVQGRFRRIALPIAVAALLLPTMLAGGVVASERLPEVAVQESRDPSASQPGLVPVFTQLFAVGWPAGRHPVIVGHSTVYDCLDDWCRAIRRTELSVTVNDRLGGAVVAPDGSVYALGDYQLEHCDAQRVCRRREGMHRALIGSLASAIALAPSGEILIATAIPVGVQKSGGGSLAQEPTAVELGLRLCRDVFCVRPTVISLGVVQNSLKWTQEAWRERLLAVGTDRAGRAVTAFRSPSTGAVSVGWCTTTACNSTHLAPLSGPRQPGMPSNEDLALLHFDDMFDCLNDTCGSDEPVATIDRPRGGVYGVRIEHNPAQRVGVQVGQSAPQPRRAVLLACADYLCRNPRRIPLVELPPSFSNVPGRAPTDIWLMAANPDGRVVLAQRSTDRIITVRP